MILALWKHICAFALFLCFGLVCDGVFGSALPCHSFVKSRLTSRSTGTASHPCHKFNQQEIFLSSAFICFHFAANVWKECSVIFFVVRDMFGFLQNTKKASTSFSA